MKWNLNNWKNSFEMRNVKIFIIMISIPLLHSCNNEKTSVIVNLELVKNESSIYENQIKISIQRSNCRQYFFLRMLEGICQVRRILLLSGLSLILKNKAWRKRTGESIRNWLHLLTLGKSI